MNPNLMPLLGGVLIGVAVSLMLLWNGRVAGISGILGGALSIEKRNFPWQAAFLAGLLVGGLAQAFALPRSFQLEFSASTSQLIIAGLLVGFGTQMSGGCTSGHGVCGISRLSPRSIVATLTFMGFGILTVFIARRSM